jgi:hypothetical protein
VLAVPCFLTFAFTTGYFGDISRAQLDNLIEVSLKDRYQQIEGHLLFSLSTRLLLRNSAGDIIVIPWEKILFVSVLEKKTALGK